MLENLLHREISIFRACVCGEKNELRNDVERREKGLYVENAQICASNIVGENLHLTPIETLVVYADTKGSIATEMSREAAK